MYCNNFHIYQLNIGTRGIYDIRYPLCSDCFSKL